MTACLLVPTHLVLNEDKVQLTYADEIDDCNGDVNKLVVEAKAKRDNVAQVLAEVGALFIFESFKRISFCDILNCFTRWRCLQTHFNGISYCTMFRRSFIQTIVQL
jgi:hypothetical protein